MATSETPGNVQEEQVHPQQSKEGSPKDDGSPRTSQNTKEVAESIEKVKVPHQELEKNIDNIDTLIGAAAELELKPKVDEKMRKLETLRRKAKEQERDHALRGAIEQLTKKQTEYKLMEKSLRKKCDALEEEYRKEMKRFLEGKDSIKQKRDLLRTIHRENMALYQKELILKQQVKPNKSKGFFITGKDFDIHNSQDYSKMLTKRSQYSESVLKYPTCDTSKMNSEEKEKISQLKGKYDYLLKVANQLKEVKAQTVEHYYSRMTEINELGTFFKECIEAGKKQLFKEQELIKAAQKGQGGTLLYELKRRKEDMADLVKSARVDYMQDRHMKTVIYEVIKRIIANAKQQKKFEHISSIKLEWEAFRDMRSLDVLALLLLRKDVLDQLCGSLFAHALSSNNTANPKSPQKEKKSQDNKK